MIRQTGWHQGGCWFALMLLGWVRFDAQSLLALLFVYDCPLVWLGLWAFRVVVWLAQWGLEA